MRDDLVDPELFGNEAGEDEDITVLNSYFVDKREFTDFYSSKRAIAFVRSKKGVGKSALLKRCMSKQEKRSPDDLHIYVKGSDLIAIQDLPTTSPNELIFGWQQRICSRINFELGSQLKLAWSDEAITLVESAELAGFKGRNLVGTLMDRFKTKIGIGGVEVSPAKIQAANAQSLLERISLKRKSSVWIFVDDIDATFLNTEHERIRTSTFFSACRNLANSVEGLYIRASVRTDVWAILKQYDESLDKCEQYILDLKWSTEETGAILTQKILSYFQRKHPSNQKYMRLDPDLDQREILRLVFYPTFPWNRGPVDPFRPIHVLSAGRPRWAGQLCKLAGKSAYDQAVALIGVGQLRHNMVRYGELRVDDLYREHRHQCPNLQSIIEAFAGGRERFSTMELQTKITNSIIDVIGFPIIDGAVKSQGSLAIAHFLYRVGFICARDDRDHRGLGFVRYEDRPNLLSSKANLDDGLNWEIHPSYRDVLRIGKRYGPLGEPARARKSLTP
jgi:hypothetical protein